MLQNLSRIIYLFQAFYATFFFDKLFNYYTVIFKCALCNLNT